MANDLGIRIDADISEITADVIAELTTMLLAAIQPYTVTLAHNASYSVGTSVDMMVLDVGAGGTVTEDWGFRIMIDSAVSKNTKMEIFRVILGIAARYTVDTIDFTDEGSYADGNGTFQVEATITA